MAELRQQEAEVARRVADLASQLGERHPSMLAARAELAGITANLRAERARIAREVQTELAVAEAQVNDLRAQIAATEGQLARSADAQVRLEELRTRADTTRATYRDMLDRYQRATEQQHLVRPPVRVISAARPPTQPDRRHALLILGFTGLGSLACGMGLAILLDLNRRGFETAGELGRETGVPVHGTLPLVRGRGRLAAGREGVEAAVFTEAVHRITGRLLPATVPGGAGCLVIGVTSALPDEGKTTVCLSIGRQLARRGRRVLLIHADLHKQLPAAVRSDAPAPGSDLVELLNDPAAAPLEPAVLVDPRSGLRVLAARGPRPEAGSLLASPALATLVERFRGSHDLIIVDTPPVLAVSDYAVVAGLAEQLLFVVRWRSTPRRALRAALREIAALGLPVGGFVLNRVDLRAYRRRAPDETLGFYQETSRYYGSGAP